jgi:hypothetical protein
MIYYALFLASLERRAGSFLGASVFLMKNLQFFIKNTLAPIDFFNGRFLSEAKNNLSRPSTGARKPSFRRKKFQIFCVRKFGMIHVFRLYTEGVSVSTFNSSPNLIFPSLITLQVIPPCPRMALKPPFPRFSSIRLHG